LNAVCGRLSVLLYIITFKNFDVRKHEINEIVDLSLSKLDKREDCYHRE